VGLIEFGALWAPKPGQNMFASGKTSMPQDPYAAAVRMELLKRAATGEGDPVRLVVFENDQKGNFKAPRWRIMLDDGQDPPPARAQAQAPPQYAPPQPQYAQGGGYPAPQPQYRQPPQYQPPQDDIPW
jgi:hypothetical protein